MLERLPSGEDVDGAWVTTGRAVPVPVPAHLTSVPPSTLEETLNFIVECVRVRERAPAPAPARARARVRVSRAENLRFSSSFIFLYASKSSFA